MNTSATLDDSLATKLDNIFNHVPPTSGIGHVIQLENKVNIIENAIVTNEVKTLDDKTYLKSTLKTMISVGMDVLDTLRTDIRVGSPANLSESFSLVYKSITESLQRMIEMDKILFEIEVGQNNLLPAPTNIQNNFYDGKDLAKMLKEIGSKQKEESGLKEVVVIDEPELPPESR